MNGSGPDFDRRFGEDVRQGLTSSLKTLHPKYFYDALGSALFDAICRLPWYRIPEAETRLLTDHASDIVRPFGRGTIIELGCGNGEKIDTLAALLSERGESPPFHLVDVSVEALRHTEERLTRRGFSVSTHHAPFETGLRQALAGRREDGPALVLFLGSNIGNFDGAESDVFLRTTASLLSSGDMLLLGADLTKPAGDLMLAYDDPLGVTAAFNRNILVRINQELGGTFDPQRFRHHVVWNPEEGRVEMHLVSDRPQTVSIERLGMRVEFQDGESIWTESSYKYDAAGVIEMAAPAGFSVVQQWIHEPARFALTLFRR